MLTLFNMLSCNNAMQLQFQKANFFCYFFKVKAVLSAASMFNFEVHRNALTICSHSPQLAQRKPLSSCLRGFVNIFLTCIKTLGLFLCQNLTGKCHNTNIGRHTIALQSLKCSVNRQEKPAQQLEMSKCNISHSTSILFHFS